MKTNAAKIHDLKTRHKEGENRILKLTSSGKYLFLLIPLMFLCLINFAQYTTGQDEITLKDSSVIKGEIIENMIDDYISIRTTDGQVKVIKYKDVLKLGKEKSHFDVDDYGGDFSIGAAIGGGGLVGVPIRYFINSTTPIEVGIHLRPVLMDDVICRYV